MISNRRWSRYGPRPAIRGVSNTLGNAPKRVLARQRLLLIDFQCSASNLTSLQRRDQVIQGHAAADVDEERGPLHALEASAVEETSNCISRMRWTTCCHARIS